LKILIQRVSRASVKIDNQDVSSIAKGVLVFVGFDPKDSFNEIKRLSKKLLNYKIFSDENGRINLSILESESEILLVPQVTLSANTKKGLKPSFSKAASHEKALALFEEFSEHLQNSYSKVKTGEFGADMSIGLVNEGPITFLFEA
jgi:D-tyrosyl-tRNA(Tyr) deacylase